MLHVTSEIGRLRKVLVHEPGREVDRMVPSMMEDLLFDDILFGERAREEHGRFRRLLQLLDAKGSETAETWEVDLHATDPQPVHRGDLMPALAGRGVDLEPIPCGGSDPVAQQREQWTDGANALALAPGIITLYDRNVATVEELDGRGWRIVDSEDVLLGRDEVRLDDDRRTCLLLASHEISRARGGPHCLTHPLERDDPA